VLIKSRINYQNNLNPLFHFFGVEI